MAVGISKERPVCKIICSITFVLSVAICLSVCSPRTSGREKTNRDPQTAKLVTSDLDNFWRAYADAANATSVEEKEKIFQREYLDKGSAGLKDFVKLRIKSAHELVAVIEERPKFYASLKEITPRVSGMEPAIRASFVKLKELYPNAVFPDVYFLIGVMNSGGTTAGSGLLIGLEMHGKTPDTDMSEMSSWLRQVLGSADELPQVVAHELIHYQQTGEGKTLLAQCLHEGSADFVGELISGGQINAHLREYGDAHEADLWREFSQAMDKDNASQWLYQGGKSKDRPADLGYYIGYRISQAYYERAADKKKAIHDILTVHDFHALLEESHYADKFSGQ
jgi:Predicted Zn-dependent protease (DUF2268)